MIMFFFFFSSRRRHTRSLRDWSSDVCSSDLNARGEEQGFVQIVCDENNGFAEAAGERAEFALKLGASDWIKRPKRLVHQQDGRIGSKGAGDSDALALTTGKFARTAICEFP